MFSVIIPNYNGRPLLERYLGQNIALLKKQGITDIIIADDASTDDSVAWVKAKFPEVTLVQNRENSGFAITANQGARAAKEERLFFLNNDMIIDSFDTEKLIHYLDQDDIFAVALKIVRTKPNAPNESITQGYFQLGRLRAECSLPEGYIPQEGQSIFWACGGAAVYNKSDFWAFGGYDIFYRPFYVEDLALSFKAWKLGKKSIYNDSSLVYHDHMTTIGAYYSHRLITHFHIRNKYMLMWQHFNTASEWGMHALWIFIKLIRLEVVEWAGLIFALKRLPQIKERRKWLSERAVLSNQDIFDQTRI